MLRAQRGCQCSDPAELVPPRPYQPTPTIKYILRINTKGLRVIVTKYFTKHQTPIFVKQWIIALLFLTLGENEPSLQPNGYSH